VADALFIDLLRPDVAPKLVAHPEVLEDVLPGSELATPCPLPPAKRHVLHADLVFFQGAAAILVAVWRIDDPAIGDDRRE
jgi:hypothetical protein